MDRELLNELINALTILPGVGKKSAQRMALYLLDKNKDGASILADTIKDSLEHISRCENCRMLTSNNLCKICRDESRDNGCICVVENPSDVLAIESTGGYKGKYFVLLGRLQIDTPTLLEPMSKPSNLTFLLNFFLRFSIVIILYILN